MTALSAPLYRRHRETRGQVRGWRAAGSSEEREGPVSSQGISPIWPSPCCDGGWDLKPVL